ncbi:MAG TPA: YceI family protein [Candidatus Acidoferrum sp.]|nr:YceI family protein [Candidatus Acidoferrum sp.]
MKISGSRLKTMFYLCIAAPAMLAALSALPQHAAPPRPANEIVLGIDPARSKVHWTLGTTLHTVHGTFAFKSGTFNLEPATGKASGEIVVYATSGDSGNDSRDKKMHKEVLESTKFQEVIFRPDRVEGKIVPHGSFTVQVHGIFILHGTEHELTVPVQAEFGGDHWTGSATFNIPFIDWGLKNPSSFFLKVEHAVQIHLELKGSLRGIAAP